MRWLVRADVFLKVIIAKDFLVYLTVDSSERVRSCSRAFKEVVKLDPRPCCTGNIQRNPRLLLDMKITRMNHHMT
jgi:hypothetical protein